MPAATAALRRSGPLYLPLDIHAQEQAKAYRRGYGVCALNPFARVIPARIQHPLYRVLGAPGVDDGRRGTGFSTGVLPALDIKNVMNALDRAIPIPKV